MTRELFASPLAGEVESPAAAGDRVRALQDRARVNRPREFARRLRGDPTRAEDILWAALRDRRFDGHKFRRQVPIEGYIVDFVCFEARLIVELDGRPYDDPDQRAHDAKRDAWLRAQGFAVARFSNDIVLGGSTELLLNSLRSTLVHPSSDPRVKPGGHLLPQGEKDSPAVADAGALGS